MRGLQLPTERGAPLALGVLGLAAGVVAAATSGGLSSAAAVVAGAAALAAGTTAASGATKHRGAVGELEAALATERARIADSDSRRELAEQRVRDLEAAAAEAAEAQARASAPEAADSSVLTDPDSKLFSEAYFRVALDARIASARRHLRPVAVALIDVFEGMAGPSATPAPPERAAESIRQTVRDADTACRLSDGTFAIILEDTPENGAVWTVERVRRNLVSRFGSHTMWAGVACYPAHAFSTEELLDQARGALESAREWKQDRIEVAISE